MSKHEVMVDKLAQLSGISADDVRERIKSLTGKSVSKLARPDMNRRQRRLMEAKERNGR